MDSSIEWSATLLEPLWMWAGDKISGDQISQILEAADRREARITAPPEGLFLVEVRYRFRSKPFIAQY